MSKADPKTEAIAADTALDITLEEFCQRLSTTDKRVEMIGAFHSEQSRERRVKDSEAAYAARFQAFVNKPA